MEKKIVTLFDGKLLAREQVLLFLAFTSLLFLACLLVIGKTENRCMADLKDDKSEERSPNFHKIKRAKQSRYTFWCPSPVVVLHIDPKTFIGKVRLVVYCCWQIVGITRIVFYTNCRTDRVQIN